MKERDAAQKLKPEKFRIMMDVFQHLQRPTDFYVRVRKYHTLNHREGQPSKDPGSAAPR